MLSLVAILLGLGSLDGAWWGILGRDVAGSAVLCVGGDSIPLLDV